MVFKPRLYRLSCPSLYMSTEKFEYTNNHQIPYFVVTVLISIAHIYGLIIRSPLTASIELLLTMSIAIF